MSSNKSNTFFYVPIMLYIATNTCGTAKPSTGVLVHGVGMGSVCWVWVPPAHRRQQGKKPLHTMVGQVFGQLCVRGRVSVVHKTAM